MKPARVVFTGRAVRTPRAAGVAGIIFSVLFAISVVLTQWAIPPNSGDAGSWVDDDAKRRAVSLSLHLLPFAGIAFLWFIGVVRDRIGAGEDRFFATVFLGSGVLFVATFFATGGISSGLIATAADTAVAERDTPLWQFGRQTVRTLESVYGMRMAAVFTLSTTTIATRLQIVPRWLAIFGYLTAVVLLVGAGQFRWLELIFPGWVFVISVQILAEAYRGNRMVPT